MKNNIVIKKDDYERYKIPISIPCLLKKTKKNYIWEELEKRHPCFSDEFCYSYKNCISKSGLFSDVIVMEKSKLAEYKNKCSFTHKLALEGAGKINVFENKKQKKIIFIISLFIFLSLFILIKFNFFSQKIVDKNNFVETIKMEDNNIVMKDYSYYDKDILGKILDISRKNKGNINSLTWDISHMGEKITCSLNNVYPEQLEAQFPELRIPTVKYQDEKPVIDFNYVNKFLLDNQQNQNENISLNSKKVLRSFLENNDIKMVEETTFPYGIAFECNLPRTPEANILLKLKDLLYSININVVKIVITPLESTAQKQKFHFYINFSNKKVYKNDILSYIGNNIDLFFNQKVQKFIPVNNKNEYFLKNQSKINISTLLPTDSIKVGEITYPGGRKIIFFKNNMGKLSKKEVVGED